MGKASAAWIMRPICQAPGVQVVASVPWAGPVPPPSMVVTPDIRASSICCGQMKWICASKPPAVRILPSPAMASVPGPMMMSTPGWVSGLPALPMACDQAVSQADIGLVDAGMIDDQGIGDHRVHRAAGAGDLGLAHAVADDLAAAELDLFAIDREILLDLDEQLRVGEPDAIARCRAEHVGLAVSGYRPRHYSLP